jgi:hypothetical protein
MKLMPLNPAFPLTSVKNFTIDWEKLVYPEDTFWELTDEFINAVPYLEEIKKYSNNDLFSYGIIGKKFQYCEHPEFERLLSHIHLPFATGLQREFIPYLFSKTDIKNHLKEFLPGDEEMHKKIAEAKFEYLNSFCIKAELSKYLYYYGMYQFFYENNSATWAMEVTREFTKLLYKSDVDNVVCFSTRYPWGAWFDQHSCTDNSFVFINRKEKQIWLFCFSHSD